MPLYTLYKNWIKVLETKDVSELNEKYPNTRDLNNWRKEPNVSFVIYQQKVEKILYTLYIHTFPETAQEIKDNFVYLLYCDYKLLGVYGNIDTAKNIVSKICGLGDWVEVNSNIQVQYTDKNSFMIAKEEVII